MIVLRNRGSDEDQIWDGILDIMVDFLQQVQDGSASDDSPIHLISPWFSNMTFPIQGRSLHLNAFEQPYSQLDFVHILTQTVNSLTNGKVQNRIKIVCRPPHDLISGSALEILRQDKKLPDAMRLFVLDQVVSQKNTIDLLFALHQVDPQWASVAVGYDERLHAKIICSNNFALVGSSNLTFGGLYYNNEVALFIPEPAGVGRIRKVCEDIERYSVPLTSYRDRNEEDYSLLMERLQDLVDVDIRIRDLHSKVKAIHEAPSVL